MEAHFKNECDSYFGLLSRRKTFASTKQWIVTIADLIEVYKAGAENGSGTMTEQFFDWMPKPKHEVSSCVFLRKSLPAPIKSSHAWSFKRTDARSQSLRGKGDNENAITGIRARAHTLPGLRAQPTFLDSQLVVAEKTAEGDEAEEDQAVIKASLVEGGTKEVNGWKCSYRTAFPEAVDEGRDLKRLMIKMRVLAPVMAKLPKSNRARLGRPEASLAAARAKARARHCEARAAMAAKRKP